NNFISIICSIAFAILPNGFMIHNSVQGNTANTHITSTAADVNADTKSANAMPDNPKQQLPNKISADIDDNDVVVSEKYATNSDGTLTDLETGKEVTDTKLVGTQSKPADPLAKTNGESFIPVSVKEVRDAVEQKNSNNSTSDSSKDEEKNESSTQQPAMTKPAVSTKSTSNPAKVVAAPYMKTNANNVQQAALQNNDYGAYWGTYNGSQAFFESGGALFAQQAKGIIDVSEWQGNIDWAAVKNSGVEGAIIRIGYGWDNGFDKTALHNISECMRLGIPFGVYLFSYAYDSNTGAAEGDSLVRLLRQAGLGPSDMKLPVFYDLERWSWTGHTPPTSPSVYDGIVNSWYVKLQQAGYNNLSVYSYASYLSSALNSTNIHTKTRWVASYGAHPGFAFSTNARAWQYTSSGSVAGIAGRVDLNAFGNYTPSGDFFGSVLVNISSLPKENFDEGSYYISAIGNNTMSMDVQGASMNNGARIQAFQFNNTKGQQFELVKNYDGTYTIRNVNSGKVLDVPAGNANFGVALQQYDSNGTKAQKWYIRDSGTGYYIQSALGDWVIQINDANLSNRASFVLSTATGETSQLFTIGAVANVPTDTTVSFVSTLSNNLYIDTPGMSAENSVRLRTFTSSNSAAQKFIIRGVGNGVYSIINVGSNKSFDLKGAQAGIRVPIQQYTYNNTTWQHWVVRKAKNGAFSFANAYTGKVIDIPGKSTQIRTNLQSYTYNGGAGQFWNVKKVSSNQDVSDSIVNKYKNDLEDGVYTISPRSNSKMNVDVQGASMNDRARIQLFTKSDATNQQWKISHDSKGYITFTSMKSGKAIDIKGGISYRGAVMQQFTANDGYNQKWIAVKQSDGSYEFYSAANNLIVLDLENNSTNLRSSVQAELGNDTETQHWVLNKVK
ncbi:MAG: RICIN domain-containing protein, partial [Bifidobacteriaceae bacterium]|nr:RICIN domain-containing protein [Bifidobacteriaceae bacterium]